ncbi:MAG: UvrD-helicase domain-containing protein [Gemmatimonadaceae bacterium]|nr:UvrD-helicase domain-containing protein [Gemmatimonadaceae bacterium]
MTLPGPAGEVTLNTAQRAAVEHGTGPLLVLAGAGSGKTRVLTARVARIVDELGVAPHRVLAVTFTNKAAGEMRERIARLLGVEPRGMWIGTFHGLGARMLRLHADRVGRTAEYTIYDEDDTLTVVRRLMERAKVSSKDFAPKAVVAAISDAKNALVTPAEYERLAMTPLAKAVSSVYAALEPTLRAQNAVSFDDLLVLPVQLLTEHADLRAHYAGRFEHLLVDEYQDTNHAQYEFVRLIAGPQGNVAVVGDDDQSIYGWRGADVRNILDFERDYPGARVVRLEENYRSTPGILAMANVVIAQNTARRGKTLRATRAAGEPVTVLKALDDRDEADAIAEAIENRRMNRRERPSEMAILYRTNSQSRSLEESLRRRGIPYRLVGAVRFYDRREVRDLLAWLRLAANPADDEAFRRAITVPRRGIGEATVELMSEMARGHGIPLLEMARRAGELDGVRPATRQALGDIARLADRFRASAAEASVDQLIVEILQATGYDEALRAEGPEGLDRLDNVRAMIEGAAETVVDDGGELGLRPLDHFLQKAMLVTAADQLGADADAVTLMTVHTAKGLEYPVVFVSGMEDGLFPLARAFDDPEMLEEERRLLYVAITRAERKLTLTWAMSRRRNGELMPGILSSFLSPVPKELYDAQQTSKLRGSASAFAYTTPAMRRPGAPMTRPIAWAPPTDDESQVAPIYIKGARVRHKAFGSGTILDLAGIGRDAKVTIEFDDEAVGRKRLVVAFAGLERDDD